VSLCDTKNTGGDVPVQGSAEESKLRADRRSDDQGGQRRDVEEV